MKKLLLASAAFAALAASSHASILPGLASTTTSGGVTTFSYDGILSADQGLTSGDQLVILNFGGYVPGSVFSPYANVIASTTTSIPAGLVTPPGFTQEAGTTDLVFTYNGPNYNTTGGPSATDTVFAGLTAETTLSGVNPNGFFSAKAVKNFGTDAGTPAYNVGQVAVPGSVPEPAAWAMMLVGFGLCGSVMRRRRTDTASLVS